MTIEQAAMMTADEARQATDRIRLALDRVSNAWADLGERIADAYQRRADLALGYGSWAEYADAELKPAEGLAAEVRRQLVGMLSQAGMSTRAIAPTVGVDGSTVRRDVQVVQAAPPAPAHRFYREPDPAERIDYDTGEVLDETPVTPTVTGLDGKTYKRPEPTGEPKPKRRPLPDAAHDAAVAITDSVDRMERLLADDRLPQNREQVARLTRNHLLKAIETLQRLAETLPN